mmetsp:Transcript_24112/g.45855  ORF Transcript_24112/g.45855 Transcript_24112/m.45855 type:complete len:212 (-) Transcript_24112:74-709(-)|eukprot:scaffold18324_cov176-Amphora_coffeaeformis.AAC.8
MKLTILSLTVPALVHSPRMANAWVCGPGGFYGLTSPMVIPTPTEIRRQQKEMLRRQQILAQRMGIKQNSPRYEITNTEERFQVALDVPGVKMEDIDITLEDDGTVLSIAGMRQAADETYSFSSKFAQSFSLDPTIDVEKFTASLKNGVLIISAPREMKRIDETIRKIPITEQPQEYAEKDVEDEGPVEIEDAQKDDTKEIPLTEKQDNEED